MESHNDELGPIDIVVIAFPADAPMTGDSVPLLMDLVKRRIIRVLDVRFVMKEADGTFSGFEARDLSDKGVGDFVEFEGASSGLLGDEDVQHAADVIEPGSAAVLIVYENTLGGAVRRLRPPQRRRARGERARHRRSVGRSSRRRRGGVLTKGRSDTMPGLLRGMARTAVIAGTATSVSNRVSRRQAERWAQEDPQAYGEPPAPAPPPAAAAPDPIEQLKELAQLHQQGVLTDEEFAAQKAKLLA